MCYYIGQVAVVNSIVKNIAEFIIATTGRRYSDAVYHSV